ncbi:Predicted periplasmic or secreted lipoprotein [Caballeronia glathei]|uniref:BON domain-containing protein n=2 Tax=Caballeronia glathei TaxID=60547 RepID=A0A069PMY9_9BURK|nr:MULTISPECIES: BON domain-containing protein [Burkholderiaceae]KDR42058.1 hypothetical protein BG61_13025 [Caballeronia glathei]TCK34827.1 BON domain-containing protein [Paraburkholderia sp. BL8N3]CDY77686.1 Predicted periplasmic or secreted lipoprotein [Caballeronia glathei]
MKSLIRRSTAVGAMATMIAVASLGMGTAAFAQDAGAKATPVAATTSSKSADRQLAHSVRKALNKTKHLDTADVRVRAKHGVVSLDGTVPDAGQIQEAGTVAGSVKGVSSVHNLLAVHEVGN